MPSKCNLNINCNCMISTDNLAEYQNINNNPRKMFIMVNISSIDLLLSCDEEEGGGGVMLTGLPPLTQHVLATLCPPFRVGGSV